MRPGYMFSGMRVHQVVTPFTVTFALIWTPATGIFFDHAGKGAIQPREPGRTAAVSDGLRLRRRLRRLRRRAPR